MSIPIALLQFVFLTRGRCLIRKHDVYSYALCRKISDICVLLYSVWSVNDELSGNLQKPAAEVSGRFPNYSINKKNRKKNPDNRQWKPVGNLRGRFPEVSRGFQIIHHWRTTFYIAQKIHMHVRVVCYQNNFPILLMYIRVIFILEIFDYQKAYQTT